MLPSSGRGNTAESASHTHSIQKMCPCQLSPEWLTGRLTAPHGASCRMICHESMLPCAGSRARGVCVASARSPRSGAAAHSRPRKTYATGGELEIELRITRKLVCVVGTAAAHEAREQRSTHLAGMRDAWSAQHCAARRGSAGRCTRASRAKEGVHIAVLLLLEQTATASRLW